MPVSLGPVLKFSGCEQNQWKLSALVVGDAASHAPLLELTGGAMAAMPVLLKAWPAVQPKFNVWRYDFAVPLTATPQTVTYKVAGKEYHFVVPAAGDPPTCAYGSCNGFSDPKALKKVADKNALWKKIGERHHQRPYHLLLLGGDQIYTDSMWQQVPSLEEWLESSKEARNHIGFTPKLQADIEEFYFNLYISRWSQPEVSAIMSSIPSVMMWDDHDIFDGWGSYPTEQQQSPVFQGIFGVAREYFRLFQLHSNQSVPPMGVLPEQNAFNYAFRIGAVGILVLDMRSERTQKQVLSPASWNAIYRWLDNQKECTHMLVMSSIPVVHPDFSTLETLLCVLPGRQELEDDLKDHWLNRAHRQERLRLIHRLLDWSVAAKSRVTILSGDVHVGAVGVIESTRTATLANAQVINQLTSSALVHPAPPAIALFYLEHIGGRVEQVDRGITAAMYEFPGTSHRFIGARNFLSLEPDQPATKDFRLWANWWVEGETTAFTKVIHAVGTV